MVQVDVLVLDEIGTGGLGIRAAGIDAFAVLIEIDRPDMQRLVPVVPTIG